MSLKVMKMFDINLYRKELKEVYGADTTIIPMNCSLFDNSGHEISDVEIVSRFSGSNGVAVISGEKGILSVDGRYKTQALLEVDKNIWEVRTYPEYTVIGILKELMKNGEILLFPTNSHTYKTYLSMIAAGIKLKTTEIHPVLKYRSITSCDNELVNTLFVADSEENLEKRLEIVRKNITKEEAILITDKNTVSWIFGIRKQKLEKDYSPLADIAAIITSNKAEVLSNNNLKEYKNLKIKTDFSSVSSIFILNNDCKFIDYKYVYGGIKTESEINAHKRGAYEASTSFIKMLAYIDHFVRNGSKITEREAISMFSNEKAINFSFNPICASGRNTAVVHYNPKGDIYIEKDKLFLFDAGFHFIDSSTDMTRTMYLGENPPEIFKKVYTSVLKSLIFYSSCRFPTKTKGHNLDAICRYYMWQYGFDYVFGTGHGVGNYRAVHEKPNISRNSDDEIVANMVTTVEPGYYTEEYGIRLENMLLSRVSKELADRVEFQTINYIPFCLKLIDTTMLNKNEVNWLNIYNIEIKNKILILFENDKIIKDWVITNTKNVDYSIEVF
ncbi:MAG: M24 family metallopeptidase [Holosporales bacterium]|jgi:Xaa-Pro aminopeptidase|nr:M24 family metallopeptidase [Holosporales bacterium]